MQDPPYAADTRAKGWRFELDYEQIEQSDTWALAAPDARPWLLMLWLVAWKQVPCGSLPSDHAVIAAKLGMSNAPWQRHRVVLLRGWVEASDGRLYHETITGRVLAMLEKRAKDAKRTAERRGRTPDPHPSPSGVTRDTPVTHAGPDPEFDTKHQAPSKEKERERGKPRPARKAPEGFSITAEMRRWALATVPTVDVDAETEKFRDHTFSTTCIDWPGRWRNWMRKAVALAPRSFADQRAATAHVTVASSAADRTSAYLDAQRMTPDEKAKADVARKAAMASLAVINRGAA